eukprot:CAMPEP_0119027900 /NCGR_PEP_ID=MMETSP1176-20130426/37940_1 /TAXON_ID=265551 /ORGANISM="Synedropsis recta cf, Strain CCMP1620" /LENGTH=481 /DNA_ID=CAMNT_0006983919 /DNA_START=116 /DNA_END=1558 /DNA_ORIENTATION=+
MRLISPKIAFALVSFSLGELGDGLNIFQGIYLVGIGWNEGSVGLALSLMGLTVLLVQTVAGDIVDKTRIDRRLFLAAASVLTALSASAILFVHEGNTDHALIYITKIIEGIAGSFIGPCLAALTLANFGPGHFDSIMASNILWGHIGSVVAAVLAGGTAYGLYPNIKYCFLVIGAAALLAVIFVKFLPEGDPLMGRGFRGKTALDADGHLQRIDEDDDDYGEDDDYDDRDDRQQQHHQQQVSDVKPTRSEHMRSAPKAASYWEVFFEPNTLCLCLTGFFFHFSNANVLLVLGELMGGDNEDGSTKRSAIPLIASAIVLAQFTMAVATIEAGRLTNLGFGRKPLFMIGLITLPIRCALIIALKDAGEFWLIMTQILDGIGGGLCGLIHPYLVADLTFGSGRFNVVMGLTASCFGLGATLSNFLGQLMVEKYGHVASLLCSLALSIFPVLIFGCCMPETYGLRGQMAVAKRNDDQNAERKQQN